VDDLINPCEIATTCSTGAACVFAMNKGHFGDPCSTGADCFNGLCEGGLCKLALGDPCLYDVTCGSGLCLGNVCTACSTDGDCPLGHCNTIGSDAGAPDAGAPSVTVCGLGGGDPCATSTDCAGGLCSGFHYCNPTASQPCSAANCPTHACPGNVCATCSMASDCPLSTPCSNGSCLAPPGAFCTKAAEARCASGLCPPPAFLDFRRCQ
jgi:hypothetical protein